MTPRVKDWVVFILIASAGCAFGADLPRFTDQAESAIDISMGSQKQTARLWAGRSEVALSSGVRLAIQARAIYVGSKQFWWDVGSAEPTTTAVEILAFFKENFRCAADQKAIICFTAETRRIGARRVSEKVEVLDFPSLVGRRISETGDGDHLVSMTLREYQLIMLSSVEGTAPLYETSLSEIGGPWPNLVIAEIASDERGWAISLRRPTNGRLGVLRLDRELRPVSGSMVK